MTTCSFIVPHQPLSHQLLHTTPHFAYFRGSTAIDTMSQHPSYLLNADPAAIDNLYHQYQADHESVDFGWRKFFEGFELGAG